MIQSADAENAWIRLLKESPRLKTEISRSFKQQKFLLIKSDGRKTYAIGMSEAASSAPERIATFNWNGDGMGYRKAAKIVLDKLTGKKVAEGPESFFKRVSDCDESDLAQVAKNLALNSRKFASELASSRDYPYSAGLVRNIKIAMAKPESKGDQGIDYLMGLRKNILDYEAQSGVSCYTLDDLSEMLSADYSVIDAREEKEIASAIKRRNIVREDILAALGRFIH